MFLKSVFTHFNFLIHIIIIVIIVIILNNIIIIQWLLLSTETTSRPVLSAKVLCLLKDYVEVSWKLNVKLVLHDETLL